MGHGVTKWIWMENSMKPTVKHTTLSTSGSGRHVDSSDGVPVHGGPHGGGRHHTPDVHNHAHTIALSMKAKLRTP